MIFALPDSPMLLCDPQNLLKGHEPIFKSLYVDNEQWRHNDKVAKDVPSSPIFCRLKIWAGRFAFANGGYAGPVFFSSGSPDHHPNPCSTGPTLCWLEHAAWRFPMTWPMTAISTPVSPAIFCANTPCAMRCAIILSIR